MMFDFTVRQGMKSARLQDMLADKSATDEVCLLIPLDSRFISRQVISLRQITRLRWLTRLVHKFGHCQ